MKAVCSVVEKMAKDIALTIDLVKQDKLDIVLADFRLGHDVHVMQANGLGVTSLLT